MLRVAAWRCCAAFRGLCHAHGLPAMFAHLPVIIETLRCRWGNCSVSLCINDSFLGRRRDCLAGVLHRELDTPAVRAAALEMQGVPLSCKSSHSAVSQMTGWRARSSNVSQAVEASWRASDRSVGHCVLCCPRDSHLRAVSKSTVRACLSPRASTTRRQVPVVKWRLTLLGRSLRCFTMYTACSHHPSTPSAPAGKHYSAKQSARGMREVIEPSVGTSAARPADERSVMARQVRVVRTGKERRTGVAATDSTAVPMQARGQVLHTVEPEHWDCNHGPGLG